MWLSIIAWISAGCTGTGGSGAPRANRNANAAADDTTLRVIAGLQYYAQRGCAACHCNSGEGGCNLNAPPIAGMPAARVDARLRGTQAQAPHPMKLPGATDTDIQNLALFLGTLSGGTPIQGNSLITRGYNLYVSGTCIACHLSSAQGANQGGIGQAIAGTDPDNIYNALSGRVPCHPLQREIPQDVPVCSITGSYATNDTVQMLTDTPPPGTDEERLVLGYFLAFISPPPAGGTVDPCANVSGQICTVAGNGISGFTADDIPATESLLYTPQNLALTDWNGDGTLDLAIDDWNNHRVRMVYIDQATPKDDGSGQMVMNRIVSIAGTGKVTGSDALNHPMDIAFDPNHDGALVISGWHNQNIYRYARGLVNGADRDQLAGLCDLRCSADSAEPTRAGDTFLALPSSIALHPDGRIFFAEAGCSRVRILTPSEARVRSQPAGCITMIWQHPDGMIETLAGTAGMNGYAGDGGPARAAIFNISNEPTVPNFGLALAPGPDPDSLYVADSKNNCIRVIDIKADPPTIRLFAGQPGNAGYADGPAQQALFNFPINVETDAADNVYVCDARNHAIRRVDPAGNVTTIAGTGQAGFNGDNIAATQAQLDNPGGIIVHPDGRIFIADTNNNRVRVIIP
jgi:cytochrome c553